MGPRLQSRQIDIGTVLTNKLLPLNLCGYSTCRFYVGVGVEIIVWFLIKTLYIIKLLVLKVKVLYLKLYTVKSKR